MSESIIIRDDPRADIRRLKAWRKIYAEEERKLVAERSWNPFWKVEEAVSEILEHETAVVVKTTRAGFTTSLVKVCARTNRSLCILVPYNSIIDQTLDADIGTSHAVRFRANSFCEHNKQLIERYPALRHIPLPIAEDCTKCHYKSACEIQKIVNALEPKRIELTYQKLEALCLSEGHIAQKAREIIGHADVLFLDEAHILDNTVKASLPIFQDFDIPEKYKVLKEFYSRWQELRDTNADIIMEIGSESEVNPAGKCLARKIRVSDVPEWKLLVAAFSELVSFAMNGCDPDAVPRLKDMIVIVSCKERYISYASADEGKRGEILVSGASSAGEIIIRDFVQKFLFNPSKKVFATSGTTVESNTLSDMLGPDAKYILLPDLMKSTQSMTMIPSKWRLTGVNFDQELGRIIAEIKGIVEFEQQPVFILTPNSRKAEVIKKRLSEDSAFWERYQDKITIQYYRASSTAGVKNAARVAIAVGFAETPSHSCDIGAEGDTEEQRWVDSRARRLQDVDAATWQAISRVKDPLGTQPSRVYYIGCRLDQVRRVALWGMGRRPVLKEIKTGIGIDGEVYRQPVFHVHVDYPLSLPIIRTESRGPAERQASRRRVDQYIAWIGEAHHKLDCDKLIAFTKNGTDKDSRYIIISENQCKVSIESIEEMHQKLENIVLDDINIRPLLACLERFVSRSDCYAVQNPNGGGYTKYNHGLTQEVLKEHLRGERTVAAYQIKPATNHVKWICFDIDNHNDKNPHIYNDLRRIISVLRSYSIPFLVEASGSPDSYHVWVFLHPTKAMNAYYFSRQIVREAELSGDCEIFPKQKKLTEKSRYGSSVKLPLGINRKTGKRSVFVDPDTFEPLKTFTTPGYAVLCEVEGDEYRPDSRHPVKRASKFGEFRSDENCFRYVTQGQLRPCMCESLEESGLTGELGHHMRLAIAAEASHAGFDEDEAVRLFEHLSDFDEVISRKKIHEVWYTYRHKPWSCEKLRAECGAGKYCAMCRFGDNTPCNSHANNQATAA